MRLVSLPLSLPLSLPFISPQCNPFIIRCAASSATVKSPCERIAPDPTAFTLVFGLGFYTRIFKIQGVPTDISVAFFSPQSLFHVWVTFLSISIKPGLKEGANGSFVHPVVLCQSYCSLTYFLSPFLVFSIHARSCSRSPLFCRVLLACSPLAATVVVGVEAGFAFQCVFVKLGCSASALLSLPWQPKSPSSASLVLKFGERGRLGSFRVIRLTKTRHWLPSE